MFMLETSSKFSTVDTKCDESNLAMRAFGMFQNIEHVG